MAHEGGELHGRRRGREMDSVNEYLLNMARRNAQVYSKNPDVRAIAVVGSVATQRATRYSDIDTILLYEKLPQRKMLEDAMKCNKGESWQILSEDKDGFLDTYRVNGIECQFAHGLVSWYENLFEEVFEEYSTDRVYHVVLYGLKDALPLYGDAFIEEMKTRIARYPRELSVALVNEHLKFPPIDELRYRTMKEDSMLRYYEILTKIATGIMGVLVGLNRMYMPRNFGKMNLLIERFEVKPENLYQRLNTVFTQERDTSLAEIDRLILETANLVEVHLPEIDVKNFRNSYLMKLHPISAEESS
ncbi:hypothetical protein AMJ40_05990 [candidate division TA06 bacterium DG_26]|uniref:Polymerase nucleotidyl transferase domain-containing protein n=1 Tax=candidate division TA06 bacterium DG_26 TaxID=1703771 RepID=A0A0S7WGE9_UNCT6|nr:MAG: hypothetical protein AMJ40_05990 [candidate division TA06 bacterium DG_26]